MLGRAGASRAMGLPVSLDLRGRKVVVVGGGLVGDRKVVRLLDVGADVTLISPVATEDLSYNAAIGTICWLQRPYQAGDLEDAWLAIAATDSDDCNRAVAAEAEVRRIFCDHAADGAAGTCHFLAALDRAPLTVAIGTGGASPFIARRLRDELDATVPAELGPLVRILGELRPAIKARLADSRARRRFYETAWDGAARNMLRYGQEAEARAALEALLDEMATL
ncbi:MAG TPA: hypothetical protein DCZ72_10070 [Armatimonadetes bacterium]|nr:hypothetical protein [Armatimonadota bacterium]